MQVRAPRSTAAIGCALGTTILFGCTGGSVLSGSFNFTGRPQLLIPAANQQDVKALAAEAARAKGWSIVKSTDALLVLQRSMPAGGPSTRSSVAVPGTGPEVIEVTSAFAQEGDGVKVGLSASLISQPPGVRSAQRSDYTETYRATLDQSLESLRRQWSARQPVAPDRPADRPALVQTTASNPQAPPEQRAVEASGSGAAHTEAQREPNSRMSNSAPAGQAATSTEAAVKVTPAATPALAADIGAGNQPDAAAPASTISPPPSVPNPLPATEPAASAGNSLVALTPPAATGVWAYYAEQYASLRGCNVTDTGAELVENRAGAEVHKVSCTGGESFLLSCQDGACRALR